MADTGRAENQQLWINWIWSWHCKASSGKPQGLKFCSLCQHVVCVHECNCDDQSCLHTFSPQFKYMVFHIFTCIFHHLPVYYELTTWPALSWLNSSVGRALHRYRRGHGFESRSGLNFFQAFISELLKAGVHVNLSEILVSLKRGWKGKKGLWNTTRQLPDRTMAPQVVGQLFGVCLPIF